MQCVKIICMSKLSCHPSPRLLVPQLKLSNHKQALNQEVESTSMVRQIMGSYLLSIPATCNARKSWCLSLASDSTLSEVVEHIIIPLQIHHIWWYSHGIHYALLCITIKVHKLKSYLPEIISSNNLRLLHNKSHTSIYLSYTAAIQYNV